MKKACHCSSVHRGLDIRIYRKQCVSLAQAGFDTHLVIGATEADIAEAASAGVTIHPLDAMVRKGRIGRMLVQTWRCYRIAKALSADIYHLHDPELIPCGLLLSWQGKKVIVDLHEDLRADIQSKHWILPPLRPAIGALARGLERLAARQFSAVVAATPHIGALFEKSAAQVAVIHNYPAINELAAAPSYAKVRRNSVCYVGGINESRGIRQIIRALETAPGTLLLAGQFDSPELREELKAYPGWRHVEECGFVDRSGVAEIMSRSFCGLVTLCPEPNYINSLPIKLFEYMSAGVPVIASDFPLWRRIVEEAECGLCVDPHDPGHIAWAINYLRTHPALAEKMGNNGRRAVESSYRWDREAAKLVALYGQLLAAASQRLRRD
jgi:glycosyltransferase involved in cell wall biosynthesis